MPLRNLARNLVLKTLSGLRLNRLALALQSGDSSSSQIIVVEMHETLSTHADQFRRQLDWVSRYFTLITPELLVRALQTRTPAWPRSQPAVLFTFDDGRESNYLVAAPLLESYNARAIFFVVTEFIGLRDDAARNYYYSKIDIRNVPPAEPTTPEIWTPMTPQQLADLTRRGHWIGSHTLSHTALSGLSPAERHRQLHESSRQIELWTGKPVDAFAWAYSWDAIDRDSWQEVQQAYHFCFTPCPGTVHITTDSPFLIWRKEIESYYPPSEYQFMYSGLVDRFWAAKRKRLKRMLGQI